MLYFMVFFYSPNHCNWYNSSLWVLVYLPLNWPLYDLEVRSRKNLREPASQTASFRRGDGCEMRRLNGVTSRQFLEFWGAETPLSTSTEPSNDAGGTHQLMFPHWGYCGLISNGALACIEYKILFLFCFFFLFYCCCRCCFNFLLRYKHCPRCLTLQGGRRNVEICVFGTFAPWQ